MVSAPRERATFLSLRSPSSCSAMRSFARSSPVRRVVYAISGFLRAYCRTAGIRRAVLCARPFSLIDHRAIRSPATKSRIAKVDPSKVTASCAAARFDARRDRNAQDKGFPARSILNRCKIVTFFLARDSSPHSPVENQPVEIGSVILVGSQEPVGVPPRREEAGSQNSDKKKRKDAPFPRFRESRAASFCRGRAIAVEGRGRSSHRSAIRDSTVNDSSIVHPRPYLPIYTCVTLWGRNEKRVPRSA